MASLDCARSTHHSEAAESPDQVVTLRSALSILVPISPYMDAECRAELQVAVGFRWNHGGLMHSENSALSSVA